MFNSLIKNLLQFLVIALVMACSNQKQILVDASLPELKNKTIAPQDTNVLQEFTKNFHQVLSQADTVRFFKYFAYESFLDEVSQEIEDLNLDSAITQEKIKSKLEGKLESHFLEFLNQIASAEHLFLGPCNSNKVSEQQKTKYRCPLSFVDSMETFYVLDLWVDIKDQQVLIRDYYNYSFRESYKTHLVSLMEVTMKSMMFNVNNPEVTQNVMGFLLGIALKNPTAIQEHFKNLPASIRTSPAFLRVYVESVDDTQAMDIYLKTRTDLKERSILILNQATEAEDFAKVYAISKIIIEDSEAFIPSLVQAYTFSLVKMGRDSLGFELYKQAINAHPDSEEFHSNLLDLLSLFERHEAQAELMAIMFEKFGYRWDITKMEASESWKSFTNWEKYPEWKKAYLVLDPD